MLHRPLIPFLFSFTGGILVAHKLLSSCQWLILPVFLCISFCLFGIIFLPRQSKILALLLTFFLTGALLDMGQHHHSQLQPLALKHKKISLEGTILEPIKIIKEIAKFKFNAHRLFIAGNIKPLNENITVTVYNHIPNLKPGDKIRFPARLRLFKNFNNPGRYDYASAMKVKGLTCAASVTDGRYIVPMGPGHMPFQRKLLEKVQGPIRDFFKENLNAEGNALYRAIILGERQGIDKEVREPFNRTGLGHVLAVSGLHIGLVAWTAFFLFNWGLSRSYTLALKIDIRKLAALLTCLPVLGYVFIAGFQVSSQRAMIMVLVFLLSLVLGREKEIWSTFALAGLLILAVDPHAIFSMSFQLSFSAVIGILWLTSAILDRIPSPDKTKQKTFLNHLYVYFTGLVAVCISATIFLLPLISYFFHQISLVSIPVNLMVMPILGLWVIPFGLLSAIALPFSVVAADFFLMLGAWGLNEMMKIVRFWSELPWSSFWTVTPNFFEMFMFYALLFFFFFFKRRPWAKAGALVFLFLFLADVGYWITKVRFNEELKVTFIDVGQANAALVQFPGGEKMMIDGGGFPRDHFDVGRMVVAPFLWQSKILKIDYLVLSHPQSDHMNGLRFIARAFHPKEFWYNGDDVKTLSFKKLMDIIHENKIEILLPKDLEMGREISGAKIEILHPKPDKQPSVLFDNGKRLNNNSLVLKISYLGKSFLFPGDLEYQGEEVLISNAGASLRSDVLLCPHHGARNSSSRDFLKIIEPRICVISSGEGNFFGFPHHQTLQRLRDMGCKIIRIDQTGAVQFRVSPDRFDAHTKSHLYMDLGFAQK